MAQCFNMKGGRIKIVLLGGAATGKTCILHRYYDKPYSPYPTVGIEISSKLCRDGRSHLRFYDMGGSKCWWPWIPQYLTDADIVFLFYDVTRRSTLTEAGDILKLMPKDKFRVILIGNKTDSEDKRTVSIFDVNKFIQIQMLNGWSLMHIETNVYNVTAFERILSRITVSIKKMTMPRELTTTSFETRNSSHSLDWSRNIFNWK